MGCVKVRVCECRVCECGGMSVECASGVCGVGWVECVSECRVCE